MKPLSIYDEDHEYLDQEKERTGVPIVKQIQFMLRQLKKDKQREETKRTTPQPDPRPNHS